MPLTSTYDVGAIASPKQAVQLGHIITQCFNTQLDGWQAYVQRLGLQNVRVVRQGELIVGGLGLYPMGQWYGGQAIPMTGIAAVGIAPQYRGAGAAVHLLAQTLQELHDQDIPLSALYASTSRLYRHVGFEQAGSYCRFSLPVQTLTPGDRTMAVTAVDPDDTTLLANLYAQRARFNSGNLDRNQAIWQQILYSSETKIYTYLIGPLSHPQGYVTFSQQAGPEGYGVHIHDWIALTDTATERFLTFLADHRSLATTVSWQGPSVDPLLSLLPEQTYQIEHFERWLLRIVNVPQALAKRGYPKGVEAELHLEVIDHHIQANTGRFVLQVAAGKGQVSPGGRGDLKLGIRGLSPLFTGLLTPHQLQALGYLAGQDKALAIAALLFAGPEPWMSDHF